MNEDDPLVKVSEAAERLRVSQDTIRRWVRLGKMKGVLMGGNRSGYRIPSSEILRALSEGIGRE